MLKVPQSPDVDNYSYATENFSPHWASKVSFRLYFDKGEPECALYIPCFASGKVKGNVRYIFLVRFSYYFFQDADLRRFCLEAQYNRVSSFVAGFPKLLEADPPASGKGARSRPLAVFLCALCASPPSPSWPTLDNPKACHHCLGLCFFTNATPDCPFKKQPPLTVSL